SVTGIELSIPVRYDALSVDLGYNTFSVDLTEKTTAASGLYKFGVSDTTLDMYSIEAGYMVVPEKFEIALALSSMDADGYATSWDRKQIGFSYFVKKHDVKFQLVHRLNEGYKGKSGSAGDRDETSLTAQYVF
ncbi:MAG: hypothetical protein HQL32_14015, partial [Planctomycetes bacterium]|nr:hypothetical protein [Planctomycetota bacterium]